jgi:GT2 family glycosyltransferase
MSRHYFNPDSPKISILIVRDGHDGDVHGILQSINLSHYPNFETIVVSLGVSDEKVHSLYERFPNIIQINLNKNTEIEQALGEGLKIAKGQFLLFLNNIQEINAELMDVLVAATKKSKRIAIVSPQVRSFAHKEVNLFRATDTPKNIRTYLDYTSLHADKTEQEEKAMFAHFACNDAFLISMDFLHRIEEKEKGSFFFLDELDIAETVHENRFKIYYEPTAIAYSNFEEKNGQDSRSVYYKTRNRLASIRKHQHGMMLMGMLLLFSFSYIPKHTFQHLLHLRLDHIFAFYRGVVWNMVHSVKAGGIFSSFKMK